MLKLSLFRNERRLYHRKCDFGDKNIISIYSQDKPHRVYDQKGWWGEDWDPLEFGSDFDFSKGFFEQFEELLKKTPLLNLSNAVSENCDYTHNATRNKDCYLLFCASFNEGCLYSYFMQDNHDCLDWKRVPFWYIEGVDRTRSGSLFKHHGT